MTPDEPQAQDPKERRQHERVPVMLNAELKEVGAAEIQEMFPDSHRGEAAFMPVQTVTVSNLGLGGVMVECGRELDKNRLLALALHLPGQAPVYALVMVMWDMEEKNQRNRWYAGMRFLAISREDLVRIQTHLMNIKRSQPS